MADTENIAADSISFADYDVFGFDVDHTLAKYNIPNLFTLVHKSLTEFLVRERSYDERLLEPFTKYSDFCTRGLILDTTRGDFLKLAEDGTILRASHGTHMLNDEEIKERFGEKRHWEHFEELINNVNNIACDGKDFRIFENFFDMPGMVVCARLIDILDEKNGGRQEAYTFFGDIFDAYMHVYNPKNFSTELGGYFPTWKANKPSYIQKCSEDIRSWLKTLKDNNKKTFIMTSSYVDFASASLEFILGPDWKDLFDLTITFAKKPSFFLNNRRFLRLEKNNEKEPILEMKEGEVYSQGNFKELMTFLSKTTKKENPKVLYFGDSLRSDMFPSKKFAGWETVMILEEMEAESHIVHEEGVAEDLSPVKKHKHNFTGPSEEEKACLTSLKWGSFFTDKMPRSKKSSSVDKEMNTLMGYVIRKYVDVAVPQLDYIAELPLDHRFKVFNHEDPKKWGFHPRVPIALKN